LEKKNGNKRFGFCIRGGKQSSLGIYVGSVEENSNAGI
jgi:hypothetical protein